MINSNNTCRIPGGIAKEILQWWLEWQIILAVTVSMVLQLLLLICGSLRKCSSSRMVQLAAWLAYMSADAVAIYALGLMLSSNTCQSVYSIWAPLLLFHLGGPDNFTAYSDTDNELWSRHMIIMAFQVCVASTVIFTSAGGHHIMPAILLIIAGSGKYAEKTFALRSGSNSEIVSSIKPICLFMSYEPSMGLDSYNYLVSGERYWQNKVDIKRNNSDDQLAAISIRDVLECKELQEIDEGRRLHSICLAHALFKLTKRRLANMDFEEAKQRKTRDFLFNEEYVPAEQIFHVIEMELGFLFDLVFTKSSNTAYTGKGVVLRLLNAVMLGIAEYLLFKEGIHGSVYSSRQQKLTYILITSAGAVEFVQLLRVILSDWTKVWIVCTYIKLLNNRGKNYIRPGLHRVKICCNLYLMKAMDKLPTWKYWKNCIEQHSIIDTCLKTRKGPWKYITQILPRNVAIHQIGTVCDEIPDEFKASVMERLHALCSCEEDTFTLSEIVGSVLGLTLLNVECINLRWASNKDMVHAILHWHIATSVCEMYRRRSPSSESNPEETTDKNYRMAKIISMYCAYVLVTCPRLLPIHPDVARMKYKEVYAETKELLHRVVDSHGDPYHALIEYDKQTTLGDGAELARQMLKMEDDQRWRILADVWFDLLLCMAVTNNAAVHVKRLAVGGEFLTIIWTLLGHVGLGYNKGDQRWERSLKVFRTALPFASMV